jgi:hypothetical protein
VMFERRSQTAAVLLHTELYAIYVALIVRKNPISVRLFLRLPWRGVFIAGIPQRF